MPNSSSVSSTCPTSPTRPIQAPNGHELLLSLLLPFPFYAGITTRQRPLRYRKFAQVLEFSREPLEPEDAQIAMRLARARRACVTLRLAVQRGLAPSCVLLLFFLASVFLPLPFSTIIVLRIPGGTIDRLVIAVASVKSGILPVFVGKFNAPPLAQATRTMPRPVHRWR